ncbi:MAG: murein biosynthesis integral membrane protein MurJ [Acidimicrobiales bacterium]|nr:murein biosynthesis integral membrane protein MurJ [Acidimicrobiales bacterium]
MSDLPPSWEGPLDEVRAPSAESGRRGSFLVAAGILLSRIAGLLREVAISGYLGVGATADVFKAALRIPNLLQNLLGEGVLSASFIPVYSRLLERNRRDAQRLAGAILGLLIVLVVVLSVIGVLLARPLTMLITPGFTGERLDLATDLLRIMFPGIGFLVLSAFCTGVLNSHREFFLSYVSPVMWNVVQIAFVVAAGISGASDTGIAEALAWGVLAGSIVQMGVQVPGVRRLTAGMRVSVDRSSPPVRDVLRRFGPVVMGRGVAQLLSYIDLVLASLLAIGAVSALTYGQVLYLLPISLFGMAVAAAELPELSRLGGQGRAEIGRRLATGLERITFYVAPVAALYLFAGDVVVGALFQRGEFGPADSRLVWFVIGAFALGLLGTTRSRLLQNGLYALDRPRLVARIAVVRVALAAALGALLMFPLDRLAIVGSSVQRVGELGFGPLPDALRLAGDGAPRLGVVGLALGAAISSWVEYRLLRGALAWRIGRLAPMTSAGHWCLIAAAASGVLAAGMRSAAHAHDLPALVTVLVVGVPVGLTYLAITSSMAVPEATALVGRARRMLVERR